MLQSVPLPNKNEFDQNTTGATRLSSSTSAQAVLTLEYLGLIAGSACSLLLGGRATLGASTAPQQRPDCAPSSPPSLPQVLGYARSKSAVVSSVSLSLSFANKN